MATRFVGVESTDPWLPDVVKTKAVQSKIVDAAGNFAATDVEGALAELSDELDDVIATGGGLPAASAAETIAGVAIDKAVTPAGRAAALPLIDVRTYGAIGDGVADDAAAVRAAAAVAQTSRRGLLFPAGTYRFTTLGPVDQSFVPLTVGIAIAGVPGQSTILIDQTTTGWRTVFGSIPWQNYDLSGFTVEDLIFDGQSNLNPINAANAASQRYAVTAYKGTNMRVRNCVFRNWDGRNIVALISNAVTTADVVTDIYVHNNIFDNIGGSYWHDHSAVYASGPDVHIYSNSFRGIATAASSAWTAVEAHGHRVHIHDNTFKNYATACLIAPAVPALPNDPASQYSVHDNSAYNCGNGVVVRPLVDMSNVDIHDNQFTIGIDQWPAAAATPYPGVTTRAGVQMYGQATNLRRVRIHDNVCRWLAYTGTAQPLDNFVTWTRPTRVANGADAQISIVNNDVADCPSAGIHVENFVQLADWDVCNNRFVNVGKALLGASLQTGMRIGYQAWTGTRPTGVTDFRYNANKFVDDQTTHTLTALLTSPAPVARVDAGCATTNGSTTVTDAAAKVTDIGSLITGTNIPPGTTITQITNSADGFSGDGFTISAAATGTASGLTLTVTQQMPGFVNAEMFDSDVRVNDGAYAAFTSLQTGQQVGGGQRPRYAYKSADQSTSDNVNLVDVADLGFPIVAGATYAFRFELFVNTSVATNGIAVAVNGPASPVFVRYQEINPVSGAALNAGGVNAFNTALVNTAAAATTGSLPLTITGHLVNGPNAGTLQLRMRSEEAAQVNLLRGSWGELTRLA